LFPNPAASSFDTNKLPPAEYNHNIGSPLDANVRAKNGCEEPNENTKSRDDELADNVSPTKNDEPTGRGTVVDVVEVDDVVVVVVVVEVDDVVVVVDVVDGARDEVVVVSGDDVDASRRIMLEFKVRRPLSSA
jgi:hypothetical protein